MSAGDGTGFRRDLVTMTSLGVFFATLAVMSWFRITDTDVPFHLASGREIVTSHHIPQTNTMGYTLPDARWGSHQWLGSVLIYLTWRAGGVTGLAVAKLLVVLGLFAFLVAAVARMRAGAAGQGPGAFTFAGAGRAGNIAILVAVFAVAAWTARGRFVERPLLLSAFLEAVLLWFLAGYASRPPRRLLWLIPLFVLWWNLHAGFIYGILILGCVIAGDLIDGRDRRAARTLFLASLAAVAAGALVTWVVNPGGLRAITFPVEMFRSHLFSRVIGEFHPSSLRQEPILGVLLGLAVVACAAAWVRGRRPRTAHILLLLVFVALGLSRVRMRLDMAVVTAPIAACYLALALPRSLPRWSPLAAALVVAVTTLYGVSHSISQKFGAGFDARTDPSGACDFIASQHLPAEVLPADMWSGWFLWRFYPERRTFIHNQLEVYGESFWREIYLPFLGGDPAWEKILDANHVNTVFLRYSGDVYRQRIADVIFADPDWTLVYWDDVALVYVRNTAAPAGVIQEHAFRALNPEHPDLAGIVSSGAGPAAEKELRRVLAEHPGCRRAWSFLGELCVDTGRLAEADSCYRRLETLATLPGERAAALAGLSRVRWSEGEGAAAESLLTEGLRWRRGDPFLLARRSRMRLAAGDAAGAGADASQVERAPAASPADLVYLAESFADSSGAEVAGRLFARAASLAMTPGERARIMARAAIAWERQHDTARAERAYRDAMAADAGWADPVNNLAWLCLEAGRGDEGLLLAQKAVKLAPQDGYSWGTLGRGYMEAGVVDSAVVAYERAVAFLGAANDVEAQATTMIGLAGAYAAAGRRDDARRYLGFAARAGLTPQLATSADSVRVRIGDAPGRSTANR